MKKNTVFVSVFLIIILIPTLCSGFAFGADEVLDWPEVENEHYYEALTYMNTYQYEEAEEYFKLTIEELKEQGKEDADLQIALVENRLGKMYLDLQRYKDSYDYLMSSYISIRDHYGETAEQTLLARADLCLYDLGVGNYELAIATLTDIYDQVPSQIGKAAVANMLGMAYNTEGGNPELAEEWFQTAILLGENIADYDLSSVYNNYGSMLLYQGEPQRALDYFLLADKAVTEHDGNYIISVIRSNIAIAYVMMEDLESAKTVVNSLLLSDAQKYGAESTYVANDYYLVSLLYKRIYDYDSQLRCLQTAIGILQDIDRENTHMMSVLYCETGSYYYFIGDYQKSLDYYERSLEISKNILEDKTEGVRILKGNIGLALTQTGDYESALEAYQDEYDIAVLLYGEDSYHAGEALVDIADAYGRMGDLEEAGCVIEEGLQLLQETTDGPDASVAEACNIAGRIYAARGENSLAKEAMYQAADTFEQIYGKASRDNCVTYSQLGDLFLGEENYSEARNNYKYNLEIMQEVYRYETDNSYYVNICSRTYNLSGLCAYKLQEYADALADYNCGAELINDFLEQNSENGDYYLYNILAAIYNNIGAVYEDMDQPEEASDYVLRAYHIVLEQDLDPIDFQKLFERMERLGIEP